MSDLCANCHHPLDTDCEEIGDEIFCGSCAAEIHERDDAYAELMETWLVPNTETMKEKLL